MSITMDYIPKTACKDRVLYRIHSRNLRFGVFRAESGGFLGLREKFGSVYLFEEFHHDNGPPHGTVAPKEALGEELPASIENTEDLGTACRNCDVPCAFIKFPDGEREIALKSGGTMKVPGEWRHLAPTECIECRAHAKGNVALAEWLREMEKKYHEVHPAEA